MNKNFSDKGYHIIKNGISLKTVRLFQKNITNFIYGKNLSLSQNKSYDFFCKKIKNLNKKNRFDYFSKIYDYLFYINLFEKILLEKKLYKYTSELLGKDLAFQCDPSFLLLNLPQENSPNKNYSFKDWHQEIWSGASISSVNIWTPIFQRNNKFGQMEFIEDSHKWGHIPHRSRSPLELPKRYKTKKLNLNYGDVVIFSALLVHRSVNAKYPRLANSFQVKNFKFQDNTFQNKNWKIYSYSEMSKLERVLGNHYLSPYRTIGITAETSQGIVKKN